MPGRTAGADSTRLENAGVAGRRRGMKTHLLFRAVAACAATMICRAADDAWFPFATPVFTDDVPAFDCAWMNEKPAGKSGWLKVDGERITDAGGRTVRLVGANITAKGNFPDPKDAPAIARHLARYGVNVVRLHFLDNDWGRGAGRVSLLPESNDPVKDGLDTNALARLDAFLAALKAEGVYVNLNLHVGRTYPGATKEMPHMSKGVDNFMPDMIQGLKDYARLLLTHVNPHTGLALKDDPAIPVLEISNEDSLLLNPWWIETLTGAGQAELTAQWNAWLRKRYADTAALQKSWGVFTGYEGGDILPAEGLKKWHLERQGGSQHEIRELPDGAYRWVATKSGAENWHMQLGSGRIAMRDGQRYELKVKARSSSANELNVYCAHNDAPWNQLGFSTEMKLGAEWQSFTFFITPGGITTQSGARIVFSLQNRTGNVEIASVQCRPVSTGYLKPEQTFEAGAIALPRQGDPWNVREDFFRFLADVEVRFANEIKGYLKKELGCRALIAHSQVLFGGPMGARREFLVSDFVDTHGYWHHPSWPRRQWDSKDWYIVNESQIRSWDGGTLAEMAMQRPAGKPYTVSEYDIPAPNDHQAELWPMFAAFAAFQGWSALYQYTLVHEKEQWRDEKIDGYFNAIGNPAKDALRPLGAMIFRLGLVAPARQRVALRVNDAALLQVATKQNGQMWGAWRDLWAREAKLNGALALLHGAALEIDPAGAVAGVTGEAPAELKPPYMSDTGEWTWDTANGTFVLNAPAVRVWSGEIGGRQWKAGDTALTVGALDKPAPHATAVLIALDGRPVAKSARLFLTALRRAENEGMEWNEKRNSIGDKWGRAPVRILGYEAKLALPAGTKWKVETLGPTGTIREKVADDTTDVEITPRRATMWWLLTRQEGV